jgi:hypothetical protein
LWVLRLRRLILRLRLGRWSLHRAGIGTSLSKGSLYHRVIFGSARFGARLAGLPGGCLRLSLWLALCGHWR